MASRIKSRTKFNNVDILSFMWNVVQKHTKHYQSDFEIDREILTEAADRQEQQDKTFIWLCRTAGTWLLLERNVFLKDAREFNTFCFYAEQTSDPVLAFLVEVTGGAQGSVMGNVYALDYMAHYNHVHSVSLKAETVILKYEHGCRTRSADARISGYPDMEYGRLQSIQYHPHSQEELTELLWNERQERKCFKEGNPSAYIAKL